MNRDLLVQNIKKYCQIKGVKPTIACRESGVGSSFINNIEARGSIPSVEKVQLLANYLGITTSELLGEDSLRTCDNAPADSPHMEREVFVQNVKMRCELKGIKPTVACKESGVGGSFISDIKRGQTPSVAKVQMLANYLGVTASELLGEVPMGAYSKPAAELIEIKPSDKALEVAVAYDATTPELQAAVRRVLGLD